MCGKGEGVGGWGIAVGEGIVILPVSLRATETGVKGLLDLPLGLSSDFIYLYNSSTII